MNLPPVLKQRYFDANGNPLAGGKLYTYQSGTTTPQATYTDQGGGTPNANPIVLDANGECSMWLDPELSYKFVLKNSSDSTQWTVDNVVGLLTADAVATASIQDDAITTAKMADDSVTADILRDDASTDANRAVTTNHIRDGAVTAPKLGAAAINSQTAETALATADEVLIYDDSAAALRKMTVANFNKVPTIQKFTSGSGTYTTPSGVRWIRVRMVGGGGAGGGSGSSGGGAGSAGGNTTFGSSLLTANGGSAGNFNASYTSGGSTTINSPAVGIGLTGGPGNGSAAATDANQLGGMGGNSAFGGGGASQKNGDGFNSPANTGAGGGGGGGKDGVATTTGSGGGAGGFIDAIITSPSASYSYSVGDGGTGGTAGTDGYLGGNGGSGLIIVEEHYS